MQVDGEEYVVDQPEADQDGVAIINPDDGPDPLAGLPTADDCTSCCPSKMCLLSHAEYFWQTRR